MTETSRPARPRADAVRNRERILGAARSAVTAQGFELLMEDVASGAGVSVATIYRHFPSKNHLVAELVNERFAQFTAEMELAEQEAAAGRDAFDALVAGLWRCAEIAAGDRGLQDAFVVGSEEIEAMTVAAVERLHAPLDQLLAQAIADGSVATDITATDVDFLMLGVSASQRPGFRPAGLGDWRRHLQIALRGLQRPTK